MGLPENSEPRLTPGSGPERGRSYASSDSPARLERGRSYASSDSPARFERGRSYASSDSPARFERGLSDETMDRIISILLRVGLVLSAALVLAGGVIYLSRHGGEAVSYRVFRGEPPSYRYLPGILQEALHIHGRGFILAGLVVLVATPVARVVFSVVAFVLKRDRVYILATLIVLAVLLFSLIWGGRA